MGVPVAEWRVILQARAAGAPAVAPQPIGRHAAFIKEDVLAKSLALDRRVGAAALHRVDPDGTIHTTLTDVTTSNGLDWSGDDRLMHYIDSRTRRIDVFDFDLAAGKISDRRPFVRMDVSRRPDGGCR